MQKTTHVHCSPWTLKVWSHSSNTIWITSLCKLKTAIAEEITRNPVVKSLAHLVTLIWKCEDNSLLLRTYHSQSVQEGRSSKPGNFCGKTLLQSASCTYELIAITGDSDHFHVLAMNKIMMH
jgi:hypothetical protein